MGYGEGLRSALEKLRVKILGPTATAGIYAYSQNTGYTLLGTLTDGFFYSRVTDLAGEEHLRLEAVLPLALAAQVQSIRYVGIGNYRYEVGVKESPVDASGIWVFRCDPVGKIA